MGSSNVLFKFFNLRLFVFDWIERYISFKTSAKRRPCGSVNKIWVGLLKCTVSLKANQVNLELFYCFKAKIWSWGSVSSFTFHKNTQTEATVCVRCGSCSFSFVLTSVGD